MIKRIAFDTPAVHNIRLRFHRPTLYNSLLGMRAEAKEDKGKEKEKIVTLPISEDLVLPRETLENNGAIKAGITVHKNDVVSISQACSDHPITSILLA